MNRNTTQLAFRINVFGYPSSDNETDVNSFDNNNLLSTERVIDSDDYKGNGGVTVLI